VSTSNFITPVLIIGFNRPRHLERLIERLRNVRPSCIFLAIDGPRPGHPEDFAQVSECQLLRESIDWHCDVKTQFQDSNLGCGRGVTAALDWFFRNVDEGIILEDDVIPHTSFLPFCTELLERYRDEERVFAVSGSNLVPQSHQSRPSYPYRFSRIPHVWGWASWKRSWQRFRFDIAAWRSQFETRELWDATGQSVAGTLFWGGMFHMVGQGYIDTWDIQLVFASMRAGGATATSNVNLTENVGFGPDGTHLIRSPHGVKPVAAMKFPIGEVPLEWDELADTWTRVHHFQVALTARQALRVQNPEFQQFVREVGELDRKRRSQR